MQFISLLVQFLLSLLKKKNPYFTGLLIDNRSNSEKEKDYLHEERMPLSSEEDPFGNQRIEKSPFPYQNQNQTSSCVPHAVGLAFSIERLHDLKGNFTKIAPIFPYRLRSIYPRPGSAPQNIFDIYKKYGAPLYTTLPTPYTEAEANALVLKEQQYIEAAIYRGKEYFTIKKNYNDIVTLATIAQQGHAVPITIFATYREWAKVRPTIDNWNLRYEEAEVQHEIAILPKSGFIENGIRYIKIQDSSGFGGMFEREVSEEFLRLRCYGAMYWDTVESTATFDYPKHTFTKNLTIASEGEEVKMLQRLLVAEGFLPKQFVSGYFAGRTLAGVKAFQEKYANDILIPVGLTAPSGLWGPSSRAKANQLCNK